MSLETLRPYQAVGAAWLAPKGQALLADDMGLGKSAQAIRACDMVGAGNVLVLCPAVARVNWEREFWKFSPFDRPSAVIFTKKDPIPSSGVVICSYDLAVPLAPKLKAVRWDVLILDEAHFLKERSAQRTKAVYGRGRTLPGLIASAARTWRLTGTPAPNNASELFTHLKSMGVVNEPYWDFVFRYCDGFDNSYGYKITGHKNVDELKRLMAPVLLRRKKEDVLKDLPPIRFEDVVVEPAQVDLDPTFYEQVAKHGKQGFYDQLKVADQTLRSAIQAIELGGRNVDQPMGDRLALLAGLAPSLTTLRRYIAMAKLPACLDLIEADLEAGLDKIVLFGIHQCTIEGARARLAKYGAVTLYGKTPAITRTRNIDKFMKDRHCRVFVGNVQAAGTAINLTSACEIAFLEQSWVPAENAQAAMRVHRIGQIRPVRVRVFSLHKSVDEQVQDTLMRKTRELVRIF